MISIPNVDYLRTYLAIMMLLLILATVVALKTPESSVLFIDMYMHRIKTSYIKLYACRHMIANVSGNTILRKTNE